MATSPDGYVLPPVSETVSRYTPIAGEHGWEGAVAPMSCLWVPGWQLLGHGVNRECWTRWTLGLIQHPGQFSGS